jgi:hypothetical protein
LRQESNFGCALCGCPILENAHIIPYEISHDFIAEDMVALCPTCHTKADLGKYSETYIRHAKTNPHNRMHVKEAFLIEGSDLIVNIGNSLQVKNLPRVLTINDFDIISIKKIDGGFLSLDINFFDKFGRLIGIILENKWIVDTTLVWDLEYRPQHLIIRNAPRNIAFEAKIEKGQVFLKAELYFKGYQFTIDDDGFWVTKDGKRNLILGGFSLVGFPGSHGGGISVQI